LITVTGFDERVSAIKADLDRLFNQNVTTSSCGLDPKVGMGPAWGADADQF